MSSTVATLPKSRREARRLSRQEAILDIAARYFLEHGYDGTTMSGIAAALGGSKGTLWSYFSSKELLFGTVLDRVTSEFRAQLSVILNPCNDVAGSLARFGREFLHKVTSPEAIALHRLVVGEANRFPEMGRIFHDRAPRQTQLLLADYLSELMERELLRRDDPLRAAQQFLSLCMSGCHQLLLNAVQTTATDEQIESDADHATQTFLRAYAV